MIYWGNFNSFFTTGLPSMVLYPSLIFTAILLVFGFISPMIHQKKQYSLWVLLLEYMFVVICSTIICRKTVNLKFDRLELTPFWTYKAVFAHTPGVSVWDIILNVVLFLPFGFLVKLIWPFDSFFSMLLIALLCSIFIETNQYFFEKGVAQFDDMMHNVIGAAIGWLLASMIVRR